MSEQWSIAPFFYVDDVVSSANYYRDKLGFRYDRLWNEPPSFAMVKRGGIIIMLSQNAERGVIRPNRTVDPEGGAWDAYIWVDDADALHGEYAAAGVTIVRPPCDQIYRCRDFEIDDLNGYRLCFGTPL
jgi:catechol 2,3-dioxygenase-like lactoylglutathione lyase family enzyme